jgi:hypothetical protein
MKLLAKYILFTTLVAGLMDISAAFLSAWLNKGTRPSIVLQYIASAVFGRSAFQQPVMMMVGLLFHFTIVFACVICFFYAYERIYFLKMNLLLNAFLVALIAWTVTALIIQFSRITFQPFTLFGILRAVAILFFCIGIPISYSAKKYYCSNRV